MKDMKPFTPDPKRAVLALVDIQERLLTAIPAVTSAALTRAAAALIGAAHEFGFPVLLTEQYPRGLGPTATGLRSLLPDTPVIEKLVFNACAVPEFQNRLGDSPQDVILCGIEAHVCVLQTAFALQQAGHRVFIAADAVASRKKLDWKIGLDLMRQSGMVIGTSEIFLFGMLEAAGTDRFKKLSALVK